MKASEIISRQNRVVYTLLIIAAVLGLVWAVWKHQHMAHEGALPAPTAAPAGDTVSR